MARTSSTKFCTLAMVGVDLTSMIRFFSSSCCRSLAILPVITTVLPLRDTLMQCTSGKLSISPLGEWPLFEYVWRYHALCACDVDEEVKEDGDDGEGIAVDDGDDDDEEVDADVEEEAEGESGVFTDEGSEVEAVDEEFLLSAGGEEFTSGGVCAAGEGEGGDEAGGAAAADVGSGVVAGLESGSVAAVAEATTAAGVPSDLESDSTAITVWGPESVLPEGEEGVSVAGVLIEGDEVSEAAEA